ncbi:hypothetical protein [Pantoea agglomerans]|uniref:hypothetical protein n=1 Tax=Enterobacter agglomerans TaxID=549 RepID=UPI002449BC9F|nr:hypothetical protein [Pantoea agglomerans]MDH1171411.1 hypothetical protein [Pantoea agglomerans]
MSNFKGTPGPWERDQFGNVVHGPIDGWGRKEKVRVSGVTLPGRVTPEYEANTQLIAASPDLLEAIQACEKILSEIPLTVDLVEDLLFARSAIARALGQ